MIKNWYAVYTKPKCERKVSSLLTKKKIDNYCPLNKQLFNDQRSEKEKLSLIPLFTSYVFVYTTPDKFEYIKELNEIINFVYWLGRPVELKGIEIENIQEFVASYNNIYTEKSEVSLNKMFRVVTKQPMISTEDDVIVMNHTIVKLTLPTLGFTLCAHTSFDQVEISDSEYRIPQLVS
jgi:transcription antitermination factor NusG